MTESSARESGGAHAAGIRSILIIRLSAIGDVAMASGLIASLASRYPQARLAWLVQPEASGLLEANPALDAVIVWPRTHWRRLWRSGRWWSLAREVRSFVRTLRARRVDLAIDVQGLLKSGVWAWLSGARERIGLGSKEGSARFMTRVIAKPRGEKHIASEYRYLAKALGADERAYRMHVALTDEDASAARALLARRGVAGPYAVICPFTTRPQKHWVEAYWPLLATRLRAEFGLTAVMLGGAGDREAASRIGTREISIANLAGETTLREAAAVIRDAKLLIGVDTALTHLGTAFEIPTVALFGSTCPYLETDSAKTAVLYKNLECAPCRRHPTCGGAFTCMKLIGVEEVLSRARRLLA